MTNNKELNTKSPVERLKKDPVNRKNKEPLDFSFDLCYNIDIARRRGK